MNVFAFISCFFSSYYQCLYVHSIVVLLSIVSVVLFHVKIQSWLDIAGPQPLIVAFHF